MKKFSLILCALVLSLTSIAQTSYYANSWKEVNSLLAKQKSKDAEALILNIKTRAQKEGNTEQSIKSLIMLRNAVVQRDEKDQVSSIQDFEKEISSLKFPEKNIMHSMIASLYHSYYQQNRWKIYKRTEIANSQDLKYPENIETWTPQLFFNKIQEQYDASLTNASGLKKLPIANYKELITQGQNTEKLQPTLFDVLVHRAIDYYRNNEIDITKAAYYFKLKDEEAFGSAKEFADFALTTQDDYSTKYIALSYLQLATRYHLNDPNPEALIDLESKRLQFVSDYYNGKNKEEKYRMALKKLINQYPNDETTAKPMLLLAQALQGENKIESLEWANKIIEKFPESIEYATAQRIREEIQRPSLNLITERADVNGKNILAKLSFRNTEKVYLKIIPLTYEQFKTRESNNSRENRTPPNGKSIRAWNVPLNLEAWQGKNLYEQHETELKIDALHKGYYAILASGSATFNEKNSPVSFALFQSNTISYVSSAEKNKTIVYALHRATGKPLEAASITRYKEKYDYNKRKNIVIKVDSKTTNKNGQVEFPSGNQYQNYSLEIAHNGEKLWAHNAVYSYRTNPGQERNKLYLFTDRAIYRPGQTVYFKGIYVNSKSSNKAHQALANKKIDVIFKDANYKEVSKQTLTTNEFGSINGTFTAPEGLLNGRFTIYTRQGSKNIRVEEYKRPKFEVKMEALKSSKKLGDNITVTGQAKAYAGNNVEGAQVKYIVKRSVRWPYYWCFRYWGAPSNNQTIVMTQGETETDADGKFNITFFAEGDDNIDARTKPFYDFEVSADVTDLNGEVRSGKKTYAISKESLLLTIDAPEQSDFNKFNSLKVNTTNVQGEFIAADVKIDFIQLEGPSNFLKERQWSAPKENLLSAADFKKYFSDYEYKNENNPLFWKEGKTIWKKVVRTEKDKRIFLQKIAPNSGYYLVKASARDKDGNLLEEKKVVRMVNTSSKKAASNEALFSYKNKERVQPGNKANISISSAFRNAYIHKSIARAGSIQHAWDQKTEEFRITENDRGGIALNYFTVYNNRLYVKDERIEVPWDNKDLQISYETFRDKILPGSQQEWKIKISGNKKEQISAELLATMYDASLDAFAKNNWPELKLFYSTLSNLNWRTNTFGTGIARSYYKPKRVNQSRKYRRYPQLNMYGLDRYQGGYYGSYAANAVMETASASSSKRRPTLKRMKMDGVATAEASESVAAAAEDGPSNIRPPFPNLKREADDQEESPLDNVTVRSNMSETAFFFPDLKTDANGNIILSFTAPEALTRWNVKAFAHTPDIQTGSLTKTLVTQKELMLTPNHPRFMRESDQMVYSSKLTNLSEKNLKGIARLDVINAKTNEKLNAQFSNQYNDLGFDLAAGKSKEITWNLNIPEAFTDPVLIRIVAQADGFSDGEQKSIPLLLNSMLVTETIPLPVRANTTKNFSFDKLRNSSKSSTLKHHKLTVEYTSNPAWYAVQALPYLTDYPYECSEQTFNRYYANALASHIANSSPRIQQIFSEWKDKDTATLLSNLEKNQELKSAVLQETPWVFEAGNETAQKKLIANLFNLNRMRSELATTLSKLEKMQTPNGGFAWFKGMRDNRFITQYIVTGIARLQKLGVSDAENNDKIQSILNKAIPYLDARIREDYAYLLKKGSLKNNNIGYTQIQYLYMRSFFPDRNISAVHKIAFNYYKNQGKKYWNQKNKYMMGMLAIALNRYDEKSTAQSIMEGLRQNAINKEEMGMYWKEFNQASYWWYEAPIEAHSLLIEAFNEIPNPSAPARPKGQLNEVDEMRIWLLKQKQTQQWKTTKATADACYALLLGGMDWLGAEPQVKMELGYKKVNLSDYAQEAGTGYTKFSLPKEEIKSDLGNIKVSVQSDQQIGTTWGAVYWQYFEQLDQITESETPLSLKKQVFKVVQGDRGETLVLVKDNETLKVGDKVKVRIELRVDRRMEFVHMKDMRGACFEPTNVLSNYKYQNGLGYYESTKDASTQFFFDNLRPGTYVFEYPMFATMRGDYSNGITTIQCMYAPEFSSHSEGIRVQVK